MLVKMSSSKTDTQRGNSFKISDGGSVHPKIKKQYADPYKEDQAAYPQKKQKKKKKNKALPEKGHLKNSHVYNLKSDTLQYITMLKHCLKPLGIKGN